MTDLTQQIAWIARLVAHDTTSRNSNLGLIEEVEAYLAEHEVASTRVANAEGDKANLYFTVGPMTPGGVVLSGHTDVVPVDGQPWDTDPWKVAEKDGKLYGRGTADMKTFSAIGLSLLPDMLAANLKHPIHFALSYDEEVGLLGAPAMIADMAQRVPAPLAVIVGEPSDMKVVDGHKGIAVFRTRVRGREAHSSQTHRGASAVMAAARLVAKLDAMMKHCAEHGPDDDRFEPPHTTMTCGRFEGGTAANILALDCEFLWDVRLAPGDDLAAIRAEFDAEAAKIEAEMRTVAPECAIETETLADGPPLKPAADNPAAELAHALTGSNATHAVSYAAEAGQFQEAGFATVICGPGSIDQAHQPNEFITLDQVAKGTDFMRKLIARLSG